MDDNEETTDFRQYLRKVGAGSKRSKDLTLEEARTAAAMILAGEASPAQMGGFLIALRVKEETPEELAGFTLAVRDRLLVNPSIPAPLIDCAGAYDGRVRSAPVGVAASLVASSAGIHFLFHGLHGLGRSGATPADLIAALRSRMPAPFCIHYLDQEEYCPALAQLRSLRNDLGLRTAFNTAEKLVGLGREGGGARAAVIGVFHGPYLRSVAQAALLCGFERALVLQGLEGSEDLQVTRDSRVCEVRDGAVQEWSVELESLGIERWPAAAMESEDLNASVQRIDRALDGEAGPVRDAILLNAGLRLYLAGMATSLREGLDRVRELWRAS